MLLKKAVSVTLCLVLLFSSIPLSAQSARGTKPNWNAWNGGSVGWSVSEFWKKQMDLERARIEARHKELDRTKGVLFYTRDEYGRENLPMNYYDGLSEADAMYLWEKHNPKKIALGNPQFYKDVYITPAWKKYTDAISSGQDKNGNQVREPGYRRSEYYRKYRTPYAFQEAMKAESRVISSLLKENPRYQSELRKARINENVKSAAAGVLIGLLLVASVYTCGASGCLTPAVASWFGVSAAGGTLAATSTVSVTKMITAVVLLEIASDLVFDLFINLYDDLTSRLIRYAYLSNNEFAQSLVETAKIGKGLANSTSLDTGKKVTPGTAWNSENERIQAIVRLHALVVIKNELKYSRDKEKYDRALLDIATILGGEGGKYSGRLMWRDNPEFNKALKAIQDLPESKPAGHGSRNIWHHPFEGAGGMIWPHK